MSVDNPGTNLNYQAVRVVIAGIAGGATGDTTVTWPVAFGDTNYTVLATMEQSTAAETTWATKIVSQASGSCVVRVSNESGGSSNGTLHVIAIHD